MTTAEVNSIEYRKKKEIGYEEGFTVREDLMKKLTDYYISENDGKTMIYIGCYHGQKKHYMGTDHEWLAGYLTYNSPYARGETYSLTCVPLKGTVNTDDKINLHKYPYDNELFKVMNEINKKEKVFLPLADFFYNNDILVNYHFKKLAIPVATQYDGFIIIPKASSLE